MHASHGMYHPNQVCHWAVTMALVDGDQSLANHETVCAQAGSARYLFGQGRARIAMPKDSGTRLGHYCYSDTVSAPWRDSSYHPRRSGVAALGAVSPRVQSQDPAALSAADKYLRLRLNNTRGRDVRPTLSCSRCQGAHKHSNNTEAEWEEELGA